MVCQYLCTVTSPCNTGKYSQAWVTDLFLKILSLKHLPQVPTICSNIKYTFSTFRSSLFIFKLLFHELNGQ